ncbi:MAG TPA: glycosyltransferase [Bryobacterales bacterium]|nr:glycosyltransferase [Bryobacterales bacterium]
MQQLYQALKIWLRVAAVVVFLLVAAPILLAAAALALFAADLLSALRPRAARAPAGPPANRPASGSPSGMSRPEDDLAVASSAASRPAAERATRGASPADSLPSTGAASVVIPNWNGRDLLEKYLPSVIAALAGNPENEIIVVDNASTDGSVEFLRERFPPDLFPLVRVVALDRNLGFGGGSNAGFRAARQDIVVLLNSDMRVDPGFLAPLLAGFEDPRVFAVSCQIFFTDPDKPREETGLTEGLWLDGRLQVRHVTDGRVRALFPAFYAGGGSSAYDRRKFLALGGFDALYEPFYLEDTDLSYNAWKRGWTVHYEPRSIVWHEHRGTIGKRFSEAYILAVLKKNYLLFAWKNIHEPRRLLGHFLSVYAGMWMRLLTGDTPTRTNPRSLLRAAGQLRAALAARLRARSFAAISDTEAFRRPLGGWFRDRYESPDPARDKLNVLFLSPYPIEPAIHGGAVFMSQTLRELSKRARVHLLCLLDDERDLETNRALADICAGVEFLVRMPHDRAGWSALLPHAARVFTNRDLAWRIHRTIFTEKIDVVQVEYTQLAVYAMAFERIATFLFEHDIYFQSIARGLGREPSPIRFVKASYEYLRALRFELRAISRFDAVQVCTPANRRFLESFSSSRTPLADGLRAGIDVARYRFSADSREPDTLLFVGNFQHLPNQQALNFFWQRVWPIVRRERPQARLIIVGAQAGPGFAEVYTAGGAEFLGHVEDIREPLARYAVFVCPVLSGSGVRVKLLEAFAAGIPAVSTPIGAEGLATSDDNILELAATPEGFAEKTLALLADPERARSMACRARREVEQHWDIRRLTARLEAHYREVLKTKLAAETQRHRDAAP